MTITSKQRHIFDVSKNIGNTMINGLFKKNKTTKKSSAVVGMYVSKSGLYAYRESDNSTHEFKYDGGWERTFEAVVKTLGKVDLQLVLNSEMYKIVIVEKPTVSDSDLPQALILAIKDMVTISISQLHIDYFAFPLQNNTKVNVIAMDRKILQDIVVAALDAGINIVGITIEEIAISNISSESRSKLIITHRQDDEALLTIIKDGTLLMLRRLRGYTGLYKSSESELEGTVADKLSLEIQRSMDYFESQLRQAPVVSIDCLIDNVGLKTSELLANNFNQKINYIESDSVAKTFALLAVKEWKQGANL